MVIDARLWGARNPGAWIAFMSPGVCAPTMCLHLRLEGRDERPTNPAFSRNPKPPAFAGGVFTRPCGLVPGNIAYWSQT